MSMTRDKIFNGVKYAVGGLLVAGLIYTHCDKNHKYKVLNEKYDTINTQYKAADSTLNARIDSLLDLYKNLHYSPVKKAESVYAPKKQMTDAEKLAAKNAAAKKRKAAAKKTAPIVQPTVQVPYDSSAHKKRDRQDDAAEILKRMQEIRNSTENDQ